MKFSAFCLILVVALGPSSAVAEGAGSGGAGSVGTGPLATPVGATDEVGGLSDILQIGPVIEVMRAEGLAYGAEMAADMFPDQGGPAWQAIVAMIYDPASMRARFEAAFREALATSDEVAAIGAFFGSELGQRVLGLEIAARQALLDPDAEDAARLAYAEMAAEGGARLAALEDFVAVNDLIESNVMGALNASLAYYQGLAEVGTFEDAMPEDQMLAEVWATEPDVRAETVDWLYPYLALAYKPLSDADLQAYQDFSETPAGRVVNAALFAAFDAVFEAISRDLGRATGRQMQGQAL